jgi:Subtilase family/Proprotein convertase P-domain
MKGLVKRLLLPTTVGFLAVAGCSSDGADAPTTPGDPDTGAVLSPSAIAQIDALIREKEARTPAQRKISSSLLYTRSGRFAAATTSRPDSSTGISSLQQTDPQGRVLVDIRANMARLDGGIAGRIDTLGGALVDSGRNHARAWLPVEQLESLAADGAVRAIRPALQAATARIDPPDQDSRFETTREQRIATVQAAYEAWTTWGIEDATPNAGVQGSAVSQGDKAHGTDRSRKFYGVDGTGVKIGVLSDSDDFKEQSIASGDLPADTVTLAGQSGRPGSGEGTAMMQIVHDLAPGAKLFFATAFISPESFADNIRRLRFEAGCDIIIDDIIYFFESPFQDDIIAQAVNDVTADGALYFSSAGNEGNFNDGTSGTWEGDFKAAGTLATLPSGYTVHNFGNGVISNRVETTGGPLILHWADPGTLAVAASSNDYDLFVLDADLRVVQLASTDIQDGDDLPFEFLGFNIPSGFRVVIAASPGAETRAIRTAVFRGQFAISTGGASYGHSSAAAAFSTAAVDAAKASGGEFVAGATTPVELFSGDGPRRIFFDSNGNPVNADKPGQTFASGGGVTRAKPDIAAADGVATTLPAGSGLNPFFGTSAAAPHAGAIAALVKSALPGKTPAQIRAALVTDALDIEAGGTDRDAGRGIVSAFNTLTRAGAKAAVGLEAGAITVNLLGAGALKPGGTALITFAIGNAGGAAATAVSATLSSSSPDVLILNGSSGYNNVTPNGSATNNTPFAFFISPTALCGGTLPFTLTVNYTGNGPRPILFNFSLQTGNSGNNFEHFAYTGPPLPIPAGNPVGVNAPFNVSGFAGSIAKLKLNIDGATCSNVTGATTVGIDHSWAGDLILQLRSPSGRTATVMSSPGGPNNSGNNFCKTILDDDAPNSIQNVLVTQAPFTGTFKPLQPLSVFGGDDPNGTWTLRAEDLIIFDTGSVRAFSIDISRFSCD